MLQNAKSMWYNQLTMENPLSHDSIEIIIDQKLNEVKSRALSMDVAKGVLREIELILKKQEAQGSDQHKADYLKDLGKALDESSVIVQSLQEFRILISKTIGKLDAGNIDRIVAHENAHANVVQSEGAHFSGYRLLVVKDSTNGSFSYRPGVKYDPPEDWDAERRQKAQINILSAPEDYGDRLSGSDKERLDRLRK